MCVSVDLWIVGLPVLLQTMYFAVLQLYQFNEILDFFLILFFCILLFLFGISVFVYCPYTQANFLILLWPYCENLQWHCGESSANAFLQRCRFSLPFFKWASELDTASELCFLGLSHRLSLLFHGVCQYNLECTVRLVQCVFFNPKHLSHVYLKSTHTIANSQGAIGNAGPFNSDDFFDHSFWSLTLRSFFQVYRRSYHTTKPAFWGEKIRLNQGFCAWILQSLIN